MMFGLSMSGPVEDEAFVFQLVGTEVEEQSPVKAGALEVMNDLGLFDAGECAKRLQFHDDGIKTEEVSPLWGSQLLSLIANGDGVFLLEGDRPPSELQRKCLLIGSLQKTVTDPPVHLHGRADNGIGLFIPDPGIGVGLRTGSKRFWYAHAIYPQLAQWRADSSQNVGSPGGSAAVAFQGIPPRGFEAAPAWGLPIGSLPVFNLR